MIYVYHTGVTTIYQATYAGGWHATVRATSRADAMCRLGQVGRGEPFTVARVPAGRFQPWGRDKDDEYTDGE